MDKTKNTGTNVHTPFIKEPPSFKLVVPPPKVTMCGKEVCCQHDMHKH